jgi:hypothetical protein
LADRTISVLIAAISLSLRAAPRGVVWCSSSLHCRFGGFLFWNKNNHGGLFGVHSNQGRTTMKLATIALASVFALSSTLALAQTSRQYTSQQKYKSGYKYKSGVRTQQGTVGMGRSMNYGGGSNNRGGLVGGADPGTYRP